MSSGSATPQADPSESLDFQGSQLVQELMRRQDAAIADLDELNDRVEKLIAEITGRHEESAEECGEDLAPERLPQAA